jgi:hypothetical protein
MIRRAVSRRRRSRCEDNHVYVNIHQLLALGLDLLDNPQCGLRLHVAQSHSRDVQRKPLRQHSATLYRNPAPVQSLNKRNKGRPVGAENKLTAEFKDVLVRAYNERGGFEKFLKWIGSSKEREDMFYSKMMIRLLPMKINVESHKDVVYRSYHELSVAFANKGLSLEAIEKLKKLDLQAVRPPPKMIEHDPKR